MPQAGKEEILVGWKIMLAYLHSNSINAPRQQRTVGINGSARDNNVTGLWWRHQLDCKITHLARKIRATARAKKYTHQLGEI